MRRNRLREAEAQACAALEAAPDDVDAIEIIALVARARGDSGAAEQAFRRIVSIDPGARWAWDDLARLLIEAGRPADAEDSVRRGLAADPDHADAHALLGGFLSEREALVEGAWHLRRAIALAGRHPALLVNLARNLMRQGALDEALTLVGEAARGEPDMLAPAILRAEILERQGALAEAGLALDHAAPIAAREGRDVLLSRATLLARGEGWREALALLDALPALSGAAQLLRGRLRDRAGRYDDAWADFIGGKGALARASGRRYDRGAVEALFAEIARIPTSLPRAQRRGDLPQPIFILGMPRSGTTLIEQVLASHTRIRAGGELPFAAEMRDLAQTLLGAGAPFPAGLASLATADHHHLPALFRDLYLARAEIYGLTAQGAAFFTDKMPMNEALLPLIRIAFPDAPLVQLRRHPLDVLVSIMSHDMTHGFHSGDRLEDAAHHLAALARLAAHHRTAHGITPHMLGYERFVGDQAGQTMGLMAAIGLAVEPRQALFHQSARHAPTPSYAQVGEPVHARSVGRWRHYAHHLAPIMPIVADAIADHETL